MNRHVLCDRLHISHPFPLPSSPSQTRLAGTDSWSSGFLGRPRAVAASDEPREPGFRMTSTLQ